MWEYTNSSLWGKRIEISDDGDIKITILRQISIPDVCLLLMPASLSTEQYIILTSTLDLLLQSLQRKNLISYHCEAGDLGRAGT